MYIRYNWESDKDAHDLNEFKKVIRKEVGKVLKPIKEYVKASAREGNSKI